MQRYAKLTAQVESSPSSASYLELLTAFPLLHGYWIAYADHEFKVHQADAAKQVFEAALAVCTYSCDLWCAYIRFLVQINSPTDFVIAAFLRAEPYVGKQFYSHKFWDLWLEYIHLYRCESGLQVLDLKGEEAVLYFILKSRTLHQFSRYFRALKLITKLDEEHLVDLYTKQQSRVSKLWRYERNLKRQVFYPEPLTPQERKTWISYIDFITPGEKLGLYARATQIDAFNEQLWMRYVRWVLALDLDPVPVFELASRVLPPECSELRLYYALWLEHTSPDRVLEAYEKMPCTGAICAERAAFMQRSDQDPREMLKLAFASASESDAAEILAVWARYEPGVFEAHKLDTVDFYKSWLKAIPGDADKVFELAPGGSVDAEYLRALRRTDLKRFVEMEGVL